MRLTRDLVADWTAGLARLLEFTADAPAAATVKMSPEVVEEVSTGGSPGPGQDEAVDPASGPSRDPYSSPGSQEADEEGAPVVPQKLEAGMMETMVETEVSLYQTDTSPKPKVVIKEEAIEVVREPGGEDGAEGGHEAGKVEV